MMPEVAITATHGQVWKVPMRIVASPMKPFSKGSPILLMVMSMKMVA